MKREFFQQHGGSPQMDIWDQSVAVLDAILRNIVFRILFALLFPAGLVIGLAYIYRFGKTPHHMPACFVHSVFGVYCPGCGSGRAVYSLLHGEWGRAAHYNVLFLLLLPVIGYYLVKLYLDVVSAGNVLPGLRLNYRAGSVILWILLAYTVARNIPLYPFTLLAP